MWKRVKRIGLLLLIGSVVFGSVALIAVQTSTFQQWLLRRVVERVNAAGYRVSAERLNIDVWRLRASLDGLVYDDETTNLTVSQLAVEIPWDAFRQSPIRIGKIEADGVVINLRAGEPAVSQAPAEIPEVVVDTLAISNASFTYSDAGTTIRVPAFGLEAQNGRGAVRLGSPITVSPDLELNITELALQISSDSLDFGPAEWQVNYPGISVNGSSRGRVQWSPALAVNMEYSTQPFSYQTWRDLESAGKVAYDDGTLKVTDLRIRSEGGTATGTAEINGQAKSISLYWNAINLAPAGFPAATNGDLRLQWEASDFSDARGEASVRIESRQYGTAEAQATIRDARANLDLRAAALGSRIRANVNTGLDQSLSGTFQATNTQYGNVRIDGTLAGTVSDPQITGRLTAAGVTYNGTGPLHASADTSLKSRVLSIENIKAQIRNSLVPNGSLRVDLDSQRVTGEIPEISIQPGDFVPDVGGVLTVSATIEGTIQKPTSRISGMSGDLSIGGTRLESLRLTGEAATDGFDLVELTARRGAGTLSANGRYNFNTTAVSGTARISNLAIDQVAELTATASLEADVSGTIGSPSAKFSGRLLGLRYRNEEHGDVDLSGTIENNLASVRVQSGKYKADATAEIALKEPYPYVASLTANGSRIAYQEYNIDADGGIRASGNLMPLSADRIEFENLAVRGAGVNLTATGTFPEGASIRATADLASLPLNTVKGTGQARIQAVVSGSLEDPQIEGTIETSNAAVQIEGLPEPVTVQTAIDFTRNEFTIRRLQGAFAEATASVSGRGTTTGTGSFEFHVENIQPERLIKDGSVAGALSLEGDVRISKPALEGISGAARVTQLELILANIPIRQVEPIEFQFENQIATARNITLEGLNTRVTVNGSANLSTRALNFNIDGNTDSKILEVFIPGSSPSGQIRTSIAIRGTTEQPDLEGFLNLADIELQLSEPPIAIADTNAQIQLRSDRIQIASASGTLNGGMFTASGGVEISSGGLGDTAVQLDLVGAQTEYPEGFQSEISSRLSLNGSGTNLEVTGNVEVLSGVYIRDIDLTQEVFSRIATSSAQAAAAGSGGSSFIDNIDLNLTISTPGSVSVANNLANFDLEGSFRVRGTVANPVITGRATVAEGGEIYFGPQVGVASATEGSRRDRYVISEGSIDFINPVRTEPNFNFVATREVKTAEELYIITLHASGTPDDPKTELTSDPPLDEPNIVALLLTGRTLKDLQGAELTVAQEQAANYLSGRFVNLFETAGSAFGLSTVRIDPVLVAGDEDLSAKLTIGRDITQNFSLVYSQNLSGASAQTWIANYQALQDFLIRGINLSEENKLTVELRHDLKWGGGPALPNRPRAQDEKALGNVTFEGATVPMRDLLKQVTKPGRPFNAYRMNEDLRQLRRFFADRDFLEAKIRAERKTDNGTVDVHFVIDEGPSVTFVFEGAPVPGTIQEEIRQIWIRGFTETSAMRLSQDRLVRYFRDEGYLQVKLAASDQSASSNSRRFVFTIAPGTRFRNPDWVFKGIQPVDLNVGAGTVLEDPTAIQQRIVNALWQDGYLNASATAPRLVIDGRSARFEISVERGPRYSIGRVTANDPEALRVLPPGEGSQQPGEGIFTAGWLDRARQSIISKYWESGFNDVEVVSEVNTPSSGATVDIDFKINPGEQQIVSKIEIEGNKTTGLNHVLRQFTFKEGDPVDHVKLNLTRKNLYDTRLFRRVDLSVSEDSGGYVAKALLNEKPPWNFRYGFAVTDQLQTSDREFGVTADLSYSNLLGKGITTGTSGKYTPDTREARVFSSLPVFLGRNATTTGALFRTRDLSEPGFISDIWGFTIQQQWQLGGRYLLSYDYSYKRNHTFEREINPEFPIPFDITIPVARFNGTLSRDVRDDILNATRGSFLSNSFEIAPPGVGSGILFLKNFAQYLRFRPVRERLVWASGVRVGLAKGFQGQDLIPTEKFRAGGGTTLRAFQQDQLTFPGDALFIVNQELRFPLFWRFSGVSFLDVGNVYSTVKDFNPLRLRYSPGAGIRIQTPLVLIRLDLGFNVSPRLGEERFRFAFGVGQAF